MEGLFHIAMADGFYHPNENEFLQTVAGIFDVPDTQFSRLRLRFAPDAQHDPYSVLGVSPDATPKEIRAAWRKLVQDNHPDVLIARGLPEEAQQLAQKRMAAINRAWEELSGKAA
jgi:DnaJ like chaperone protein